MKIRTDFVTNSSSSSFMVSIRVKSRTKGLLYWDSGIYSEDDNGEIFVNKSAKQFSMCSSVDELADMIRSNVVLGRWGEPKPAIRSNSKLLKGIKSLPSMDDIWEISIRSNECYPGGSSRLQEYIYDRKNGIYKMNYWGHDEECEGDGGELIVEDIHEAVVMPNKETYCGLTITLFAADGRTWREYKTSASGEDTMGWSREFNSIKIIDIREAISECKSLEEIIALANQAIFADKSAIKLGDILVSSNRSVNSLDDLFRLKLVLKETLNGFVSGETTYIYDFKTQKHTLTRTGNVFSHDAGAVCEVVHEGLKKISR